MVVVGRRGEWESMAYLGDYMINNIVCINIMGTILWDCYYHYHPPLSLFLLTYLYLSNAIS